MNKKRIIFFVLLLTATHTLSLLGGAVVGRSLVKDDFLKQFEVDNAHIILAHYSQYRDIALDMQVGRDSKALCQAELMATTMLAGLELCLDNPDCKNVLSKKALVFAPEILGDKPLPIKKRITCP